MQTGNVRRFHRNNQKPGQSGSAAADRRISRRAMNLRELCTRYGDPEILDRLGVTAQRLTELTNGQADINNEMVMFIEDQLHLPSGWLDGIHIMALETPLPDLPEGHQAPQETALPLLSVVPPLSNRDEVVTQTSEASIQEAAPQEINVEAASETQENTEIPRVEPDPVKEGKAIVTTESESSTEESQAIETNQTEDPDVYRIRQINLNRLLNLRGMRSALGRKLSLSGGLIKEYLEFEKMIEDGRAKEFENAFGLPAGWLDHRQTEIPEGTLERVHPGLRQRNQESVAAGATDTGQSATMPAATAPQASPVSDRASDRAAVQTDAIRDNASPVAKALAKTILEQSKSGRLSDKRAYQLLGEMLGF